MELTIEQALQQAIEAHKAGKLQDAEGLYRAILSAQPKHPDANHNLGVLAVSLDKTELALPLFKTALEANPSQGQFWKSYVDALIKQKQFENARSVLEQGMKMGLAGDVVDALETQLTPIKKQGPTFVQQLKMASSKKQKKPPLNQANPIQERRPSQSDINLLLDNYQKGQYVLAENLAKKLILKCPNHPLSWKVLGAVFMRTGRLQESLHVNNRAVDLSPHDAQAHNNLGTTLQELGRLEEAETSLKKAIEIDPDLAEAHSNLGSTRQKLGRLEDAETSYKKAIAVNPDFAEAHNNLGVTLQERGQLEDAEKSFRKAIALKSDFAEAFSNLSIALIWEDKLNEAAEVLLKLIEIDPDNFGLKAGVNLAILNFLNENLTYSKQLLSGSVYILNSKKSHFKNEITYWNYLYYLLETRTIQLKDKSDQAKVHEIYVIGESHSLASHGLYVKIKEDSYLCKSLWISGCKQWHLGNSSENEYKYKFQKIIQTLPSSANILLAIGEIDCRLDDGILKHIKKYPYKNISDLTNSTIKNYLNNICKSLALLPHKITIQGVPCPNIDIRNTKEKDVFELINLIKEFNFILKEQSIVFGFNFLDLHKMTDRGDGFSNTKWHIDSYHISPSGMQEAWRSYFFSFCA